MSGKSSIGPLASRLGEKQTIPARHGVASFLPKGHTVTIINTYGSQVVDTWAFALGAPPADDEKEEEEEEAEESESKQPAEEEESQEEQVEESTSRSPTPKPGPRKEKGEESSQDEDAQSETPESVKSEKTNTTAWSMLGSSRGESQSGTEEKTDSAKKGWSSYIPNMRGRSRTVPIKEEGSKQTTEIKAEKPTEEKIEKTSEKDEKVTQSSEEQTPTAPAAEVEKSSELEDEKEKSTEQAAEEEEPSKPTGAAGPSKKGKGKADNMTMSKSWSSYMPKMPSVRSIKKQDAPPAQGSKDSKGWAAYLPTGHGFTAYLPSKSQVSALMGNHQRDPNKSYAEQLYEFSKTPVGAAGLSVATGSGYASTMYAAYNAYNMSQGGGSTSPMEFLSMSHTRATNLRISPKVGDVLVSNLQLPLMTLVEDTSNGVHDTIFPACDPLWYKQSGVEKWEEHGSCAENLSLALKQLNQQAGLKGRKAVGAEISVNVLPSPLNLFMAVKTETDGSLAFGSPSNKKGVQVKLRAERDLVIVMSACPEDQKGINGKKPMVAHFKVESPSEEETKKIAPKDEEAQKVIQKAQARMEPSKSKAGSTAKTETPKAESPKPENAKPETAKPERAKSETPKPEPSAPQAAKEQGVKNKPRKLRVGISRETSQATSPTVKSPAPPASSNATPEQSPAREATPPVKRKPKKLQVRSGSARAGSPAVPSGKAA